MKKNEYDFPVSLMPIHTLSSKTGENLEIAKKKAVVRQDNGDVLGIVSDKYQVLKHADVIDGFREALKGQKFEEKITLAKGGAQLYASYRLNAVTGEVKKGDIIALQFIVKNSYDGSNSLQLGLGALRLVCTNGMVTSKKFFGYTRRHIGTDSGLDIEVLSNRISMITEQFKSQLPIMQKMAQKSAADIKLFDAFPTDTDSETALIKLPQYLIDEATSEWAKEKDKSVWGLYNAYTYAITHKMKSESPQRAIEYGRIAWAMASELVK